jgi:hypothetical protein
MLGHPHLHRPGAVTDDCRPRPVHPRPVPTGTTTRELEDAGYSRSTLQALDLVLAGAFGEQTGRALSVWKPRESDDVRPVWTVVEARLFLDHVRRDRLYSLWRLLVMTGVRRGELCCLTGPTWSRPGHASGLPATRRRRPDQPGS